MDVSCFSKHLLIVRKALNPAIGFITVVAAESPAPLLQAAVIFYSHWKLETFYNLKHAHNLEGNHCEMKLCLKWHNLSLLYIWSSAQIQLIEKIDLAMVLLASGLPSARLAVTIRSRVFPSRVIFVRFLTNVSTVKVPCSRTTAAPASATV